MSVINVKSGNWLKLRTYFEATRYSSVPPPTSISPPYSSQFYHELGQVAYKIDRRYLAGRLIGDLAVAMPLPTQDNTAQKNIGSVCIT
jgi:hypothetical protein